MGRSVDDFQFYIHLDNAVPDVAQQIYPYFKNGFLPRGTLLLIYRYYDQNAARIQEMARAAGVSALAYAHYRDIPRLSSGVCFYTHNALSNIRLVNNRALRHVLLLHGESEKAASFKAIARVYDYLLISGERAFERYAEAGIFRASDRPRFIKLGDSVLSSNFPSGMGGSGSGRERAILFAPTWEGACSDENYSTLGRPSLLAELLRVLAVQDGAACIILQFHPNTGLFDSQYIAHVEALLERLGSVPGPRLIAVATRGSWLSKRVLRRHVSSGGELVDSLSALSGRFSISRTVCDVSAVLLQSLVAKVPVLVLTGKELPGIQLPSTPLALDSTSVDELPRVLEERRREEVDVEGLAPRFVDYEDPQLRSMTPAERFEWLVATVAQRECHA